MAAEKADYEVLCNVMAVSFVQAPVARVITKLTLSADAEEGDTHEHIVLTLQDKSF